MNVDVKGVEEIARPGVGGRVFPRETASHTKPEEEN